MSLGVHFALTAADQKKLLGLKNEDARLELITEVFEEKYLEDSKWSFQSDKAWDAIHRALTDGRLLYATGPFPLAYAVLGGKPLDVGDDYTACFTTTAQVAKVAAALMTVKKPWLRERYFKLEPKKTHYAITEEDFEYTWSNFEGLPEFFARAARAKRSVLFTTDC